MHWSKIASDFNKTPISRGGHTLTLDSTETRIILFGGQQLGADEQFFYLNDLHVFDVETLEWFTPKVGGKLPPPRAFHSAFCIETKFYVFGGSGPKGTKYNDVWCLDLETSVWEKSKVLGKPPSGRYWHSSTLWGQKLYVFCGCDGLNDLADVHVLNLETMQWEDLTAKSGPHLPRPRSLAACACVDGAIFLYGGMMQEDHELGNFHYVSELRIFDSEQGEFIKPKINGLAPAARAYHQFTLVGDKVLTFGGWKGADPIELKTVNYLETRTLAWESVEASGESPPGSLYGHGVVAVGASLVVFGGWDGRNATNQTYILDCASLFQ